MNHNIANIRNEYTLKGLHEEDLDPDPLIQFSKWFDEAVLSGLDEPNAMLLSTLHDTRPSARIVLLKDLDHGFKFFTNYSSSKGKDIETNAQVALTFFWKELERQVRIEGVATKTSEAESDEYFASRPRGSQIGALVSAQSEVIENREILENKNRDLEAQFKGRIIPRPDHWGGYRIIPDYIEFWQGRPSRLHDRLAFQKVESGDWKIERLSP
ncbi:pyridoxamine 5'-phosphate oxidase [Dyadobacter psychrotolerans]|uniref:Pyridoxine/pyridoxamine 5'-phosphate oxidase n=1 Tax=Dyadobacter psychrotolerans TaxID=2541721 RepID=A0A4R5DTQ5_9BACT|nr:pyridoxamine 5'-phosphate oxidase [Dyadobacter psychrotolerans]TDE15690.1 pyridoxamine 5'-phosphate oxidase [Dyadobacter psychrotolerans]